MASSSCAATPSSILTDRKRVIGELTRGRDIANQLRLMLRETPADGTASVSPAQDLVGRIFDTFTHSLSMLCTAGGESDEVSQVPAVVNSPGLKSEDSGDSCKTPASKDRRGCYKRRKTSETWINETTTTIDDGHAWRKYGQKTILNTKYPRNYFRCTHKFDQGCPASKQVQQTQEDPPLFRTTYHGLHTCNNLLKAPHHIIMNAPTPDSSIIWSFQSREGLAYKPENSFVFDSSTDDVNKAVIKQEKEEDYNQVKSSSSPSHRDYYISPELTSVFDASNDHLGAFSSGSDHGDVISCTASTRSVDMDLMVGSVFDDFLDDQFESLS